MIKPEDVEKLKKWLAGNSARSGNLGKQCLFAYGYIEKLENELAAWCSMEVK